MSSCYCALCGTVKAVSLSEHWGEALAFPYPFVRPFVAWDSQSFVTWFCSATAQGEAGVLPRGVPMQHPTTYLRQKRKTRRVESKKGKELHVLTSSRCHASVTGSETASLWQSAGGHAPKLSCAPLWVLAVMFWVSPHLLGKDQGCSPGLDEAELNHNTVQVSTHWAGDGGQSFPDFCCLAICTVGDLVYCRAFLSFRALPFLHRGGRGAPRVTWTSPWVACAGCCSRQLCPTGLCNPTELLPQPRVLVKPATTRAA